MGSVRLAGMILGVIACIGIWGSDSWGGETKIYATSGYFTWDEQIGGADFIKERGMMNALGISRSGMVLDLFLMEGLVEVWGGNLDYNGHDVTNTRTLQSDTTYLGTRVEVAIAKRWPITGRFAAGPLAGAGHKFWIRTRSSEDWNLVYGKIGAVADYSAGEWQMKLRGGVDIPLYTRSHVSLEAAGFEDVVTRPRGQAAPFVEASVRQGAWSIGLRYEEMRFAESARVATRTTAQSGNGVAVIDSQAFQPASTSKLIGMKLEYHF